MRQVLAVHGALSALAFLGLAAANIDCNHVRVDGVSFKFQELDNEYSLAWYAYTGDKREKEDKQKVEVVNFDLNICRALDKSKQCSLQGTRICGIEDRMDEDEKNLQKAVNTYPVAGEDPVGNGHRMSPKWTLRKQGVRLEMDGPKTEEKIPQKAIIEFICKDKEDKRRSVDRREDDNDEDGDSDGETDGRARLVKDHPEWADKASTSDKNGGTITIKDWGYNSEEKGLTLELEWKTPFACENAIDDPDRTDTSGGWGFFSWLFFLSFIGLIGYFSFFAWINYTRYGKSGFDMLPHADTLRELPQLLGEYTRKIISTLRGGHAGGGYSAL